MSEQNESGKARLLKGSLLYFWEELKTLNRPKLRAMKSMLAGYLKMKFAPAKKAPKSVPRKNITLVER